MSVQNLATAIKNSVEKRLNDEARAMRGTIVNGRFQSGNKQEKIYRKIMKKLLQFVKDRVTL